MSNFCLKLDTSGYAAGDSIIGELCPAAIEIAKKLDLIVEFEANGDLYAAFPWSTPEGMRNAVLNTVKIEGGK